MAEELKSSGSATALATIGFIFGLIGLIGSFIPCFGALAFLCAIPAAIASAIAVIITYTQNAKKAFAVTALTVSLLGVVISGVQYFGIIAAGEAARQSLQR